MIVDGVIIATIAAVVIGFADGLNYSVPNGNP